MQLVKPMTRKERIRDMIKFAKAICKDNSHGYNNTSGERLGDPDYACSSFVAACVRAGFIHVPLNSYTSTMKRDFKGFGFVDVADKINFKTGRGLRKGDILIAPGKHTEICVSSITKKLAGARGVPNSGKPQNGKPGDQTGHEISIRKYYDDGWTQCLRYFEPVVTKGIVYESRDNS